MFRGILILIPLQPYNFDYLHAETASIAAIEKGMALHSIKSILLVNVNICIGYLSFRKFVNQKDKEKKMDDRQMKNKTKDNESLILDFILLYPLHSNLSTNC